MAQIKYVGTVMPQAASPKWTRRFTGEYLGDNNTPLVYGNEGVVIDQGLPAYHILRYVVGDTSVYYKVNTDFSGDKEYTIEFNMRVIIVSGPVAYNTLEVNVNDGKYNWSLLISEVWCAIYIFSTCQLAVSNPLTTQVYHKYSIRYNGAGLVSVYVDDVLEMENVDITNYSGYPNTSSPPSYCRFGSGLGASGPPPPGWPIEYYLNYINLYYAYATGPWVKGWQLNVGDQIRDPKRHKNVLVITSTDGEIFAQTNDGKKRHSMFISRDQEVERVTGAFV